MTKPNDIWNRLVQLRDKTKDPMVKEMCDRYLRQLNTASGSVIVPKEAELWLSSLKNQNSKQ